jgi:cell division initiation protein
MVTKGDPDATLEIRRLTPLDIHNKEFKKGFRGYDESEVDEFLDLVVAEFERIVRQNEESQAVISGLESRLEHYKGLEETLKNSIVLAQKTADETRETAHREASVIKKEAIAEAARMREDAQDDLRRSYRETELVRDRLLRFQVEMRTFLKSTMDMIDKGVGGLGTRLEGDTRASREQAD